MWSFQTRAYGTERTYATEEGSGQADHDPDTHYGRKTGKPHEVTIWFVLDDDKLYIGTANVNRQWVRNVQKTPKIRLSIGGETFEGDARFLTERAEHEGAMAAIRQKYWMFRPLIALGRVLTSMGLMRDNTGSFEVTLAA
jgi:deazaflavin-dependent oxidoreductase (nitroreductase family)